MKKILIFILIMAVSSQSYALNLSYTNILEDIKSCRKTTYGCTAEQEIEIAKFNGTILDSTRLEGILSDDTEKSYFIPLSLTNSELLTLAVATSLGVVAFGSDQEIMNVIQRNKSTVTQQISNVGEFLGTGQAGLAIAAGSYFIGLYIDNNKLKKAGLFIIGANLATSITTLAVKNIFDRSRPFMNEGPYTFFDSNKDSQSFYSGHTAQAFSIATVIAEIYKEDYPIVPYVAYGIAAITGYARMHEQEHWASDVIIGAVAGHLVTKLAINLMSKNKDKRNGFEIYPGIDPNSGKFMVYFDWHGKQKDALFKCTYLPEGMAKVDACLTEGFARAAND